MTAPEYHTIKWRHYLPIYAAKFPPHPKCILEIGVEGGGSLQRMRGLYPEATIAGIDINPACKNIKLDGVKIFIGSQTDKFFLADTLAQIPPPDVVIDDGGHRPYQQLASFNALFPALTDGGVYCVEDLHVSYERKWRLWQDFFGGFIPFAKQMVDKMNIDPLCGIKAVEFAPWMCFITKGITPLQMIEKGNYEHTFKVPS